MDYSGESQPPSFLDDAFCQLGTVMARSLWFGSTNRVVGVTAIFLRCDPFKILKAIIVLLPILVVGLMSIRGWCANKRQEHQSTQTILPATRGFTWSIQKDMVIAAFNTIALKVFVNQCALAAWRLCALNVTKSGNTVTVFKAEEGCPLFFAHLSIISCEVS